ncbi:MAG TPA: MauE/DoxX family redox-associated membrane protein [Bryobacteraceae bacterium]|nr:MauE/DoxX family redox-associated membrane protein [Bryobacteraceae bacterium]
MNDSTADPADLGLEAAGADLPAWKKAAGSTAALLLALLFFVSGCWKLTDPFQWAHALTEFRVPSVWSLPFTLATGIGETFAAVLILVPRFRRWGSLLIGLLLVVFMVYIGANYSVLAGKDCSCFPLVKRTIGPGFFIGDVVMLLMAAIAGWWARQSENLRAALVVLGVVVVFAGVSFGVNATRLSGLKAPATITVDGKPFSLDQGDIFLFFYDPECLHCDAAAKRMSKLNWKNTRVVAIPTHDPQFAAAFLHDTGLTAVTSFDTDLLRSTFKFVDPPYGVALQHGRQKVAIASWEDSEPAATLRKIGFVE